MIIETHAHYDDKRFEEDRDKLLSSFPENGIGAVMNVGADFAGCVDSVKLAGQYGHVYAAIGIHPSDIADLTPEHYAWIKEKTASEKVRAIGEIGLDYYWEKEPDAQKRQRDGFRRQLKLAEETQLPVIIHSRDAAEDTIKIMRDAAAHNIPGVIHCFSYSKELALEYEKMGYYIGVGGVVTFKNAKKLKEAVAALDLSSILLETDCPYMAPEPYRGKRNDSTLLPFVVSAIADIKGVTEEQVISATEENARKLFKI